MEIRQGFRTAPTRPIALALAMLAVLALAVTSWYVLGTSAEIVTPAAQKAPITSVQPQGCGDPYSVRDSICAPLPDPYSPHDPLH